MKKKRLKLVAILKRLMCVHVHYYEREINNAYDTILVCVPEFIFGMKSSMTKFLFWSNGPLHTHTHTHTHFPVHFTIRIQFYRVSRMSITITVERIRYALKMDKNKLSNDVFVCVMFVYLLYHVLIEMIHFSYAPFQRMSSFLSHFVLSFHF